MARIEGGIVIGAGVDVVFGYVADQRNEPQYNPRMVRAEKITDGPVGPGTRFRSAVAFMGRPAEMLIEFTEYDRPTRLSSSTTMRQGDTSGTLTFEPVAAGTLMRWSWQVRPKGAARLLGPALTRMGARQEQAIWASMKRHLEAREAGRPVTRDADDRPGASGPGPLAGQGRPGKVLLAASVAGLPLVLLALRRLGRRGGLLVEAGCGALFARDMTMTVTGTPARLRALPRFLLFAEAAVSGLATFTGLWAWVWRPFAAAPASQRRHRGQAAGCRAAATQPTVTAPRGQAVARVATIAAAMTFALHTAREAIYLSPGHGRR